MGVYTGVGSRKAPAEILDLLWRAAVALRKDGWTARSGHAEGSDQAVENGARASAEIYLPWPGFNGRVLWASFVMARPQPEAFTIAREFHPNWAACSTAARALHARNAHQILGPDVLNPVLPTFVLCWTPGARVQGGTATALRLAEHYGVDVYNLALATARGRIERWTREAA
jgi:hypothetical protein